MQWHDTGYWMVWLAATALTAAAEGNLLLNGDCSRGAGGAPEGWTAAARPGAVAAWESTAGKAGSPCLGIRVDEAGAADAVWRQTLSLQPHTAYLVKGAIRGEGIREGQAGADPAGPSIAVSLWQCDSRHARQGPKTLGSFDWTPFVLDAATGPDGRLTIICRFGGDRALGTAWFDDLEVVPNPDVERFAGRHTVLSLYTDEVALATRAGVERAVAAGDQVYEAYAELTGRTPDTDTYSFWAPRLWDIGALGWSGNPVLWVAIPNVLKDNWPRDGFCPEIFLHELAHNFDYGPWVFDGHFSELFFYYACETRNLAIAEDAWRQGAATRNRWVVRGRDGCPNVCAVVLKAIEIRDKVGWEPFRRTYRWYHQGLQRVPIPGSALAPYPTGEPGGLTREVWRNLDGTGVRALTAAPRFRQPPDEVTRLTAFETPADAADAYGDRVRGFLCPAETADYLFWLSCDDDGELWLSPDEDPAHKERIAWVEGWTAPRCIEHASQQSRTIPLQAGKRYYIEAVHVEGGGGDHLSVAWSTQAGDRVAAEDFDSFATAWGRFRLYFRKLAEYSGYDVWSHFSPEDLALLERAYGPAAPEPTQPPAAVAAEGNTVWLTDTAWEEAKVGWLKPARDVTGEGTALRSEGALHMRGLYAHAPSRYAYRLGGRWRTFAGSCGLQRGHAGSVVFAVKGDGRELFRSPLVTTYAGTPLRLDVTGIDRLELLVEDGGDSPNSDWGIWFSPRLER